jgi:hypothetical protein
MATLNEAERAREQASEYLRRQGAHAVGVERLPKSRANTESDSDHSFGVIAYFSKRPAQQIPNELKVKSDGRLLRVPLSVRISPQFELE